MSLSAFAFLFSEMVQYSRKRIESTSDLERKLELLGHNIGLRVLELISHREKSGRRETKLVEILQFITSVCWKSLFGKPADGLQKSAENENEYMISELQPITNKFISVPAEHGKSLNCAAYIAGIIAGILEGANQPARVTAHLVDNGDGQEKTVFLIKMEER